MVQLNPIFRELHESPKTHPKKISPVETKQRKTRFDKTHDIKIPLSELEKQRLMAFYKQYKAKGMTSSLTVFNTQLLRFMLRNSDLIDWDLPYKDTKRYVHVKPNQIEYNLIGGADGYSIRKGIFSERKCTYLIIASGLRYLERGGVMSEEQIQPIRPA
jgi:hypothetical protein